MAEGVLEDRLDGVRAPTARPAPPAAPAAELWFKARRDLRADLRELWQARELIRTLSERDLRARYKQAVLGFAWALMTPLMLMLVFSLVFTRFAKIDAHGAPYALFSYVGLIPWTFFSTAVGAGGLALVVNLSIVNKVYCPREVFPIATMAVAAVDAVLSLTVLGVLFAVHGYAPKLESFYAPLLLAVLLTFTIGVTLAVSSLIVYLRDLRHALPLVLQLGLFATPIAYGIELIADTTGEKVVYGAINPLAPVIDGFRRTILFGQQPDWLPLAAAGATSLLMLIGGYTLFKRLEVGIADIA